MNCCSRTILQIVHSRIQTICKAITANDALMQGINRGRQEIRRFMEIESRKEKSSHRSQAKSRKRHEPIGKERIISWNRHTD